MAPLALPLAAAAVPTKTAVLDDPFLLVRQAAPAATVTVVSGGGNGGGNTLDGGAIAGIVIGSVVGFLLLLWILRSCLNLGAPPQESKSWYHDVEPERSSYDDRHHHHHHRHRSSSPHRHHHHRREYSRSRSGSDIDVVVAPAPAVVRDDSRRHSRSRRPETVYVSEARGGWPGKYYTTS